MSFWEILTITDTILNRQVLRLRLNTSTHKCLPKIHRILSLSLVYRDTKNKVWDKGKRKPHNPLCLTVRETYVSSSFDSGRRYQGTIEGRTDIYERPFFLRCVVTMSQFTTCNNNKKRYGNRYLSLKGSVEALYIGTLEKNGKRTKRRKIE